MRSPSPGSLPLLSSFKRQAPYLDGCARVSTAEMLKGNRKALPHRIQVVLNYLEAEGKASSELWPGPHTWSLCGVAVPFHTHLQSLFPCVPSLASPRDSLPPHLTPGSRTSDLYARCHFPSPWRKNSRNGSDFPRKSCQCHRNLLQDSGRNNHSASPAPILLPINHPHPLYSWVPRASFQTYLLIKVSGLYLHCYYTTIL